MPTLDEAKRFLLKEKLIKFKDLSNFKNLE